MLRITADDVQSWAGDSKFLRSCSAYMPISKQAIEKLCLYFPHVPPEFKSVLVDLAQRAFPREEKINNTHAFNCWGTFDKGPSGKGLLLYTSTAFESWGRIQKTSVFTNPVSKELFLGVSRRPMALNHV